MELNSAKSMVDVARAADRFVCAADCVAPERALSRRFRTKRFLGCRICAGGEVLAAASYKTTLLAPIVQNLRRCRESSSFLVLIKRFIYYTQTVSNAKQVGERCQTPAQVAVPSARQ